MRCLACGYTIIDLHRQTCPECGNAFDPHNATTFEREPWGSEKLHRGMRTVIALCTTSAAISLVATLLLIAAEFATTPRGPRSELEFFAKFALALALLSITASVLAVIAVSESLSRLNAWKRYRTSLIWVATSWLVLFATLALL